MITERIHKPKTLAYVFSIYAKNIAIKVECHFKFLNDKKKPFQTT